MKIFDLGSQLLDDHYQLCLILILFLILAFCLCGVCMWSQSTSNDQSYRPNTINCCTFPTDPPNNDTFENFNTKNLTSRRAPNFNGEPEINRRSNVYDIYGSFSTSAYDSAHTVLTQPSRV